jgi:hypothetical protein
VAVVLAGACSAPDEDAPACEPGPRLAIVAQSVPGASYVPCLGVLPAGWSVDAFHVDDDGARFSLRSDRADRPIVVELLSSCALEDATPTVPAAEGVRTYQLVRSISPRYAGRILDVFPGGCVTFDFELLRGPHIALLDELDDAVQLYSRRQLRQELADQLDLTLDP